MTALTRHEILGLREASKNDRALIVGSEIRQLCDMALASLEAPRSATRPIPMLLFCPRCQFQHVDAAEPESGWTNPPHATHTCKRCGLNWRPSNALTDGVASLPASEMKHVDRMLPCDPTNHPAPKAALPEELPPQETLIEWRGTLKDIACRHDKCEEIEAFFSKFINKESNS